MKLLARLLPKLYSTQSYYHYLSNRGYRMLLPAYKFYLRVFDSGPMMFRSYSNTSEFFLKRLYVIFACEDILLFSRVNIMFCARERTWYFTGEYIRVRTHWTDKICFTLPKFSTKFVSAKFSICRAWAHRYRAKYLLTTSFNDTEINTIACSLFAGKVT